MDKADCCNLANQAVNVAKEGSAGAISLIVGSNATNSVICLPDGNDYKVVHMCMLHKVIEAAITGVDRPATIDVLQQLVEIINFAFDF